MHNHSDNNEHKALTESNIWQVFIDSDWWQAARISHISEKSQ